MRRAGLVAVAVGTATLLLLLGGPAAQAADPADLVSLNFQDLELSKAIETISQSRDLNIVYPPGLDMRVTVRLKDVPWEKALSAILRMHGYGFIRTGAIVLVDTLDRLLPDMPTRNYRLRQFPPETMEPILKSVLGETGSYQFVPRPPTSSGDEVGTLLVTAPEESHATVAKVLSLYEVPEAQRRPRVEGPHANHTVDVHFVDTPADVALRLLGRAYGLNVAWEVPPKGRVTLEAKRLTVTRALEAMLVPLGFRSAVVGNTVRVAAKEGFQEERVTKVYDLKYALAADVRTVLQVRVGTAGSLGVMGNEKTSRQLIVSAEPPLLAEVAGLIRGLDRQRKQILVNLYFVEISLSDSDNFGVDWSVGFGIKGSSRDTRFPLASIGGVPEPATFKFGTMTAENLSAAFSTIRRDARVRLLSEPSLTAQDNEEATILVGQNFPITVETLDRQTLQKTITLDRYEEIGIKLKVLARVTEAGVLDMSIEPQVSEVGELIDGRYPVINTRQATTRVQVASGNAVVIGGLIRERSETQHKTVPLLSRIPGLGALFRNKTHNDTRSELLIFVVPQVMGEVAGAAPVAAPMIVSPPSSSSSPLPSPPPPPSPSAASASPTPTPGLYDRMEGELCRLGPIVSHYVATMKRRTAPYDFLAVSRLHRIRQRMDDQRFVEAVDQADRFGFYDPTFVERLARKG